METGGERIFSSDMAIHMEKEYLLSVYPALRKEAADAAEVALQPVYFDELCYLLNAEGSHMILVGGPWSAETQAVIGQVNACARRYGVETVYLFDCRADGRSEECGIKAERCAYIYGELVRRHLPNLGDFARGGTVQYRDANGEPAEVPDIREPFLFIHNRGRGILAGAELSEAAPETVFRNLPADMAPFTHADYLYEAFRRNTRGRSPKTEDCFRPGEPNNICPVTLAELLWLLEQKGTFLICFAGAWCLNSQAGIATINDFAAANKLRVYMLDTRPDGKYPAEFWGYDGREGLSLWQPAFRKYNYELWGKRLAGAPLLCATPAGGAGKDALLSVYTDEAGTEHAMYPVNIPYLAVVSRDRTDAGGKPQPVAAGCNHGGIELLNYSAKYVYARPNYRLYTAGLYACVCAYCGIVGTEPRDISVDRSSLASCERRSLP